jgi:hypothetical protein
LNELVLFLELAGNYGKEAGHKLYRSAIAYGTGYHAGDRPAADEPGSKSESGNASPGYFRAGVAGCGASCETFVNTCVVFHGNLLDLFLEVHS